MPVIKVVPKPSPDPLPRPKTAGNHRHVEFQYFLGFFVEVGDDAESGVPILLGLFSMMGLVSTFLAVALLTLFVGVNAMEIKEGKASDGNGDFVASVNGLMITAVIGFLFATLAVFLSILLTTSLSILNIPKDRNDLLLIWIKRFYFHIVSALVSTLASLILCTTSVYFISYIKYPDLIDPTSQKYYTWKYIGIVLWIAILLLVVHFFYVQYRFSFKYKKRGRTDFNGFPDDPLIAVNDIA